MALATLHSNHDYHETRYTLKDVDCKVPSKYACSYNPDFMGFHFVDNINFNAIIDITLDSMTTTTCMVTCKGNPQSMIAILANKRCICSGGNFDKLSFSSTMNRFLSSSNRFTNICFPKVSNQEQDIWQVHDCL